MAGDLLSRRDALASVGVLGLALAWPDQSAEAQKEKEKPPPFEAKKVTDKFFLTKSAQTAAGKFVMGKNTAELKLDPKHMHAGVKDFKLTAAQAKKAKRSVQVVEGALCGITDKGSNALIRKRLEGLKVPKAIRETSAFFFCHSRRRVVADPKTDAKALKNATILSKEHKTDSVNSFIMGITKEGKKVLLTFLFSGRKGAFTAVNLIKPEGAAGDPTTTAHDDDSRESKVKCLDACLKSVVAQLGAGLAFVTCPICAATLAAVIVTAANPLAVTAAIAACVLCLVGVGMILGSCLIICA